MWYDIGIMKKKERKILKKLYKSNKFCDILQIGKGITAVIGSGGKTSLIYKLCKELAESGRVVFTTTTHVMRPEHMSVTENMGGLEKLTEAGVSPVCIGSAVPDNPRKLSAPNVTMDALADRADYVLVEADGSKMLPIKAHKSYEPVIPKNSSAVILVVGLSGIGGRVAEKVHRIEEFEALTGAGAGDIVTAEAIAGGIAAELPNYKGFDVSLYLNQTDVADGRNKAEAFAAAFRAETGEERGVAAKYKIYAGSLREGYIYEL